MTDLGETFEVIVRDSVPSAPANGTAGHTSATAGTASAGSASAGPASVGGAGQDAASTGLSGVNGVLAGQPGFGWPASTENTISGFGLAVISGLADDVRISATGSGVSVRMTWPAALGAEA